MPVAVATRVPGLDGCGVRLQGELRAGDRTVDVVEQSEILHPPAGAEVRADVIAPALLPPIQLEERVVGCAEGDPLAPGRRPDVARAELLDLRGEGPAALEVRGRARVEGRGLAGRLRHRVDELVDVERLPDDAREPSGLGALALARLRFGGGAGVGG